jgi:hypothetical protein
LDRNDIALKRNAFKTILSDPVFEATVRVVVSLFCILSFCLFCFQDLDQFEKSTPERREQSTRRLFRFAELLKGKSEEEELALIRALSCVDSGTTIRWFVQRLLWIETIRNQGLFFLLGCW